ncbi:hypothetical protein K438DRAFT_2022119 [Mycena galopus ATCC 62051]|nr:hypothetical protein K438DRAFT_2022119 [Mycena galopus ATCC 62051]
MPFDDDSTNHDDDFAAVGQVNRAMNRPSSKKGVRYVHDFTTIYLRALTIAPLRVFRGLCRTAPTSLAHNAEDISVPQITTFALHLILPQHGGVPIFVKTLTGTATTGKTITFEGKDQEDIPPDRQRLIPPASSTRDLRDAPPLRDVHDLLMHLHCATLLIFATHPRCEIPATCVTLLCHATPTTCGMRRHWGILAVRMTHPRCTTLAICVRHLPPSHCASTVLCPQALRSRPATTTCMTCAATRCRRPCPKCPCLYATHEMDGIDVTRGDALGECAWGQGNEVLMRGHAQAPARGCGEMIPIGTRAHRDRVRANRFVNGADGTAIPEHIKIAKEGEPIRTLGAWVGNGVDQVGTWARTIEKVDAALEQWELGKPTMEGRRLIILMVVGGMTQYMAKVQGMPKEVETRLEKRVRKFLWAEKTNASVNQETVYAPADLGGKNLLDIVARNEAIAITWLKSYLKFGKERPLWALAADSLLSYHAQAADDNVDPETRVNMFLQAWDSKVHNDTPDGPGNHGQDSIKTRPPP